MAIYNNPFVKKRVLPTLAGGVFGMNPVANFAAQTALSRFNKEPAQPKQPSTPNTDYQAQKAPITMNTGGFIGPKLNPPTPSKAPTAVDPRQQQLDSRLQSESNMYNQQVPMIDELYNLQKSESLQNIKALEEARKNTEKGYANNIKQVGEQYNIDATNTANEADKSIRQLAESKRLTDAGRQQTFANLNTIDSGGYNGFTGQQQNADSAFLGNQAELLQGKMQNLQQLKMMKQQKEQTALTALEQEKAAFNAQIRQINATMVAGSVESKQAKLEAFQGFQDRINGIKDSYYQQQQELDKQNALKPIPASQASDTGEIRNSLSLLSKLKNDFNTGSYDDIIGPIQGRVGSANPYNEKAQVFNSKMLSVAQIVGKAMEGGVLRTEDVAKYRAILPNINDTKEVADGKIRQVEQMMQDRYNNQINSYSSAGYNVSGFDQSQQPSDETDALVNKYWQ